MINLFSTPTDRQLELIEKRNKLIDEQETLKVHHYRTEGTVLTDEDKKHGELQLMIRALRSLQK